MYLRCFILIWFKKMCIFNTWRASSLSLFCYYVCTILYLLLYCTCIGRNPWIFFTFKMSNVKCDLTNPKAAWREVSDSTSSPQNPNKTGQLTMLRPSNELFSALGPGIFPYYFYDIIVWWWNGTKAWFVVLSAEKVF